MGLTMEKILDKFADCNMFSLTGKTEKCNIPISKEKYEKITKDFDINQKNKFINQILEKYTEKYTVTEIEYLKAIKNIKEKNKIELNRVYNKYKDKIKKYPDFNKLYLEIENECYFLNKRYYLAKYLKNNRLKTISMTDEEIDEISKYACSFNFIVDNIGKITKYGSEYKNFFYNFYAKISENINYENSKEKFCYYNGKNPIEQLPDVLKKHLKYYEISFYNSVTTSLDRLMINYYFPLNEETKKFLLSFRNDFDIPDLEDLTIYKDNKIKFYSCTHEEFNSIKFDYKEMDNNDILSFINDEYPTEKNDTIIDIVNKLIKLNENTKFSFKDFGVDDTTLMYKVCKICDKVNIQLILANGKELPAIFCDVDELLEKIN